MLPPLPSVNGSRAQVTQKNWDHGSSRPSGDQKSADFLKDKLAFAEAPGNQEEATLPVLGGQLFATVSKTDLRVVRR